LDILKIFSDSSSDEGDDDSEEEEEENESDDDEIHTETDAFLLKLRARKCKTCGQPIEMDAPSRCCKKCDYHYCLGCLHQVLFSRCMNLQP
jgi:hypothetical protein